MYSLDSGLLMAKKMFLPSGEKARSPYLASIGGRSIISLPPSVEPSQRVHHPKSLEAYVKSLPSDESAAVKTLPFVVSRFIDICWNGTGFFEARSRCKR